MPADRKAAIDRYRKVRQDAFVRMAQLRERMDAWLEAHEDEVPTMAAMATLEGLHGERIRIVTQLEEAERSMIDTLIRNRPDSRIVNS